MHDINSGVMVNMPDDPARIVRFWHAVEMFSPQQLPKTDAKDNVADFRPGDPMPWEPAGKLDPPRSGKVWRHEVFGGVYDLSKIRDVLVEKYGQDDPEAPTRGQSALFACTVDADGYLLEDSAVLSACAWAIGRILRDQTILTGFREEVLDYAEGLQKLTGVTKILADSILSAVPDMVSGGVTVAVSTALGAIGGPLAAAGGAMAGSLAGKLAKSAVGTKGEEQAKTEAGGESRPRVRLDQAPLTGSDLYRFTAELADRLGVTTELRPRNIRVNSYQISVSRADEPPERQTFLNSYIADDLSLISTALDRRDAGTALCQYLTASPGITRTDVQKEPLCVRSGCAPDRIRPGRWVTGTDRPLAFSQPERDQRPGPYPWHQHDRGQVGRDDDGAAERQERDAGDQRRVAERLLQVVGQEQEGPEQPGRDEQHRQVGAAPVAVEHHGGRQPRVGRPALPGREGRQQCHADG